MSYIDDNLLADEGVIYRGKPHWIIFVRSVAWLCIALAILIIGSITGLGSEAFFTGFEVYKLIALVVLLAAVISGLSNYFAYKTSEFAITNRRVIIKIGVASQFSLDILLERIESITVFQSLLGRIWNYGTLVINGTGGSRDYLHNISAPAHFRNLVQQQIEDINLRDQT